MNLLFEDQDCGTRKVLGIFDNEQDTWKKMIEYIKEMGIKPYYYRSWKRPNTEETVVDYGSHTKFFIFQP